MPKAYSVHNGVFCFPGEGFQLQLRRVQRDRFGRLYAEVVLLTEDGKGYLAVDRGDLSSGRFRETLAGQAAKRNSSNPHQYDNLLLAAYVALQQDPDVALITPPPAPIRVEDFLRMGGSEGVAVVHGLLDRGGLYSLASKPKTGKTILLLNLALAVTLNRPWLSREVNPGRVILFQLEDSERTLRRRLETMAGTSHPADLWLQVAPFRLTAENFDASVLACRGVTLLIVDPLIMASDILDWNDQTQVRRAYDLWRRLARETGAAIVTAAHHRKLEGEFGDQMAGSIQAQATVDGILELYRDRQLGKTQRRLSFIGRDWGDLEDEVMQLNPDTLWWEPLGALAEVVKDLKEAVTKAKAVEILEVLPPVPPGLSYDEIADRTGLRREDVIRSLKALGGGVGRSGQGKKADPYRFWQGDRA